jgi:hypothetical protein
LKWRREVQREGGEKYRGREERMGYLMTVEDKMDQRGYRRVN